MSDRNIVAMGIGLLGMVLVCTVTVGVGLAFYGAMLLVVALGGCVVTLARNPHRHAGALADDDRPGRADNRSLAGGSALAGPVSGAGMSILPRPRSPRPCTPVVAGVNHHSPEFQDLGL